MGQIKIRVKFYEKKMEKYVVQVVMAGVPGLLGKSLTAAPKKKIISIFFIPYTVLNTIKAFPS